MNERPYLYQIIRYVPDLRRMEPRNIGVLVQGQSGVTCRLWTHFRPLGEKPDFDYANFRKWREFFDAEINGPQIKMFQPPRESPEFLEYLQSRCKGNYILTRPLQVAMQADNIAEVEDYLYQTLVKPPEDEQQPAEQPVKRFRDQLKERRLDRNRLLRVDEYVILPNGDSEIFHWQYEKNHGSNQQILIEPVQWRGQIRLTQIELEHVVQAAEKIRSASLQAKLIVVMDDLEAPSELAKDKTKRLYDNYLDGQKMLRELSDEVITKIPDSENLVRRIETDLRELLQA